MGKMLFVAVPEVATGENQVQQVQQAHGAENDFKSERKYFQLETNRVEK